MIKILKRNDAWKALSDLTRPQLIGPDRATAIHSENVLLSYSGEQDYIRPEYAKWFDIIGTQSRYVDNSATETHYKFLAGGGLRSAWCTMCSQEWYR